ncbi:MAG: nitroreductase family protein [Rhodospirillales bacterium]|nr:nitroreductase family protein [Rhodospirillales bacterium]
MIETDSFTSETSSLLADRVSVRRYSDKPVPAALVDAVLQAAFRAPTSSNIQAYSVVVVRDQERLKLLSAVTGNQKHVAATPVFLAFCADLTRMQAAMEKNGKSIEANNLELGLVSSIDAALVGMATSLVAESFGLKGVMIGAVRNDPTEVARILGLPKRVFCVFGMCLGWPDEAPVQKPRMAQQAMVHYETYGNHGADGDPVAMLEAYDRDLYAHYTAMQKLSAEDSWTAEIAKKFSPQPRAGLRAALRERGFDFL